MEVKTTALEGVLTLRPRRFEDARGFFSEVWNRETLHGLGIHTDWVQDNQSLSRSAGTVRGLHYQAPPHAQDKLVRVLAGRIFDVAVDVRRGSPTFGQWAGIELSAENGLQLLIPKGFLHGFVTREADSEVLYKCSDIYAPDCEGAVRWDDPGLGIDWGMGSTAALLSDKDRVAPGWAEFETPFTYEASA